MRRAWLAMTSTAASFAGRNRGKLKSGVPYVIRQNMPTEGVTEFTDLVFGKIAVENRELEDQILIKSGRISDL